MSIDEAVDNAIKEYVKGKQVLDLGGYQGRECALALQSGATQAICVDDESWRTYDNWADEGIYKNVVYFKKNFMEYNTASDIVILKNVIYHQRNPWKTLEHVRNLTRELLILSTSYVDGDEPVWRVYRPYEGHPKSFTVAWRPTLNGLKTLLEATGFTDIEILVENDYNHVALTAKPNPILPRGFGERN